MDNKGKKAVSNGKSVEEKKTKSKSSSKSATNKEKDLKVSKQSVEKMSETAPKKSKSVSAQKKSTSKKSVKSTDVKKDTAKAKGKSTTKKDTPTKKGTTTKKDGVKNDTLKKSSVKKTSSSSRKKSENTKDVKATKSSNKKLEEKPIGEKIKKNDGVVDNDEVVKKKSSKKTLGFFGRKYRFDIFDILIIITVSVIFASVITGLVINYQYRKDNVLYSSSLKEDENLSYFISTYSEIVDNYYEEIDNKGMVEAAINGMMDYLSDNYSIYLDKVGTDSLNSSLSGTYTGIGVVVTGRKIVEVYEDSPADKAGLQVDDVFIKVNDVEIDDENYGKISEMLHQDENETSVVVVQRGEEELVFELELSEVIIDTTTSKIYEKNDKKIGYLSLSSFAAKSYEQFQSRLIALESQGMNSLIIDLRGNSGGYLNVASDISNLFLKKDSVIYSLESKDGITEYKDKTEEFRDYPIVILVNSGTASAAEVLTTALKDNLNVVIVGTTTFGKGKVQTLMYYDNDTMIKYTSAKWLRPNGDCIDEVGIVPDYEVMNELKGNIIYDKQLDKAIELMN